MNALSRYMSELKDYPCLTKKEEEYYASQMIKGNKEAQMKMIEGNARLVVKIAADFKRSLGVPMEDAIAVGNLALAKCAGNYCLDRGAKFSTYVAWWIKKAIHEYCNKSLRQVNKPIKVEILERKARRERNLLEAQGVPEDRINEIIKEKYGELGDPLSFVSLNQPVSGDENEVGETFFHDNGEGVDEIAARRNDVKSLRDVLADGKTLTPLELDVVKSRHFGDSKETLREIGLRHGVSYESVRLTENKALQKLREAMGAEAVA